MCRPFFLACRLPVFPSWVVFLVSGLPCLAASPPDGSRFGVQGGRLQLQGSCFQSLFRSVLFFSFRACRVSPQVRWMAPVSRCRVPVDGRRGSLPILVCLFPVAGCLLLCVGLFFLLAGCLFFRPVLFFSFRACRVSPQARWMALVSRCRVPVYGRRGPASNLSVPVSRCGVPAALCRAPFLAFRLLVFPSWIYFLVSGVPRLAASPLDASRFALQGAR